jgi:hypothetical protein
MGQPAIQPVSKAVREDISQSGRKALAATALSPAAGAAPAPGRSLEKRSPARAGSGRRSAEQSDVLVSAVISTYLLTHLHHVLQRAEYAALQEGRQPLAANYAQLRKVLCLDARTMEDASACGHGEAEPPCAA